MTRKATVGRIQITDEMYARLHPAEDAPVDLMATLEKSLEPSGTCVDHGDYWSDECWRRAR